MARALTKESLLSDANFIKMASQLYTAPIEEVAERYSALSEGFKGEVYLFSSPGRAELIGNHTDHNHGLVIAASIDMDVAAVVQKTNDNSITIKSVGFDPFTICLDDLEVDKSKYGKSQSLCKGVCKGFLDRGYKVGGFVAVTKSTIFRGAGVSSSAAFELLMCEILNVLYNDGQISVVDKAIISRFAENVYFGKPSGLMDQLTISRGGVSYMDFKKEVPDSTGAPWNFDDLSLVIINCGGDHCDLTDEYAAIRYEMNSVAKYFGKEVLIDVSEKEFYDKLPELKKEFTGRALLRAMHFFDENSRVQNTLNVLSKNDKDSFLELIKESGRSSYMYLQNCYPTGDKAQSVPLALAIVSKNQDTLAYRVHGGGFAGTILCFVDSNKVGNYTTEMKKFFGDENVFDVKIRKFGAITIALSK